MGKLVGYARVSTEDQDLTLQIDALRQYGVDKKYLFQDKISGSKEKRPGLDKALSCLEDGDTLIVWRLDRLGRSMPHLIGMINDFSERGVGFKSIQDGAIDTTTASGELIFNIFSSLAQFERKLTQERTKAGLSSARARGRFGGRPKRKATDEIVQQVKMLYHEKKLTVKEIVEICNVKRTMVYNYINI